MSQGEGEEVKRKWEMEEERAKRLCWSLFIDWLSSTGPFEGWNESWVVTRHTHTYREAHSLFFPFSGLSPSCISAEDEWLRSVNERIVWWQRSARVFPFQTAARSSEVKARTGLPPVRLWHSSLCIVPAKLAACAYYWSRCMGMCFGVVCVMFCLPYVFHISRRWCS